MQNEMGVTLINSHHRTSVWSNKSAAELFALHYHITAGIRQCAEDRQWLKSTMETLCTDENCQYCNSHADNFRATSWNYRPRGDEDIMRAAATLLGRKGGKISSPKKTRAVQENGRKGGRPKKSASEDKTDKHSHLPSARGQ